MSPGVLLHVVVRVPCVFCHEWVFFHFVIPPGDAGYEEDLQKDKFNYGSTQQKSMSYTNSKGTSQYVAC